jgi:hypothetical protein
METRPMIDLRIGLVVTLLLGCSTPPTVALSHPRTDAGTVTAPDGSDIITTHTIGVGIADVIAITPDRNAVVSVQSSNPTTLEVAASGPDFVFLGHAAGHATVTILVGNEVAMTFDATVVPQM